MCGIVAAVGSDNVLPVLMEGLKRLEYRGHDSAGFAHYRLKEIHEQPEAVANALEGRLGDDAVRVEALGPDAERLLAATRQVHIVACGTSYHAGLVARYWLEELAGVPCQVEVASEYRYRKVVAQPGTLFLTLSQSGETADTLAALRHAGRRPGTQAYAGSLAICNVPGSSLVRESDLALMTHAGSELGVASTKAFTTQLTTLMLVTLALRQVRGGDPALTARLVRRLRYLPTLLGDTLMLDEEIARLADDFAGRRHALSLGRGSQMPVVAVASMSPQLEKLRSNLQEVRARGGQLLVFADPDAGIRHEEGMEVISVPACCQYLAPIVYTVPLQLLAYRVAVARGTDVDQPRNLAKSVIVE
ncbi:hypothetical protein CR158_02845 [Halomonas heilongjiangensis]|uniref:Glutamine--fructose-6-phosphate aminotransferase [isomerizing] n=1 Tax=Halomonas heilongjiangensis TaxID=1387883 RepID=A0A2N7TRA0_9GAMM|nr:hypothetical protein C1H66_05435 [Halomonas heilongjiangensis]PXX93940.1 hypothetical protein CR158_02845 [Halomonas heilongjiangensis]